MAATREQSTAPTWTPKLTMARHALGGWKTGRQGQAGKRVITYLDTGGGAWGVGAASSVSVPIRRKLNQARKKYGSRSRKGKVGSLEVCSS